MTEPDADSDPGSMRTRAAVRRRLHIVGFETWITNAPIADVLLVWAKDDDGHSRGFLVERGPGLETPKIEGDFKLRASVTGSILMDAVFVPDSNVMPDVRGLRGPFSCLG